MDFGMRNLAERNAMSNLINTESDRYAFVLAAGHVKSAPKTGSVSITDCVIGPDAIDECMSLV
jgi:hypothetical protein